MKARNRVTWKLTAAMAVLSAILGTGCTQVTRGGLTGPERAALRFQFEGLFVGAPRSVMDSFSQVEYRPRQESGMSVYEIYNPSPHVSLAVAWIRGDIVKKFELRYFDGEGIRTLKRAGGWKGLRDRLVELFGEPTRNSPRVPVLTNQRGINARYAAINAEWVLPRAGRTIHFVAMEDNSGGVAVITVADNSRGGSRGSGEDVAAIPLPTPKPWKPDPGF